VNEANKRLNIRDEMERASEVLRAARLLYDNGFVKDAISRLYYSILYSVRALLLTKGLEPKSHEAALRLFGLHFVKSGAFEPRDSHVFSKLMKYREEADYNPTYIFMPEDFTELATEADRLIQKIAGYLKDLGYA